jgi:hypothetical protein
MVLNSYFPKAEFSLLRFKAVFLEPDCLQVRIERFSFGVLHNSTSSSFLVSYSTNTHTDPMFMTVKFDEVFLLSGE